MKFAKMICSTAAAAAALTCTAAVAQDQTFEQRTVMYADLNLNHPEGVKTLYSRIRGASRSVCVATVGQSPLQSMARRDCTRTVLAAAVSDVDDARLTAYYADVTGKRSHAQTIAHR